MVTEKMISKTFPKPRRVPLMPEGDGIVLGNHLRNKLCTEARCVCVLKNGLDLICVDHPNLTCANTIPLMGWGFVDYFVRY